MLNFDLGCSCTVSREVTDRIGIEEYFRAKCKAHDLTYGYSDDHKIWQRGADQMKQIKEVAAMLPRDVAVEIWNSVVDEKLNVSTEARKDYYWDAQ